MEENKEKDLEVEASAEPKVKDEVEKKIRKEIEKKREKNEQLGVYRIAEYLKEEHKWESYLFIVVALLTLVLGMLILNGSLVVRNSFPLIGDHPKTFAWILIGVSGLGLLYAVYPFYKPCFSEFKKITWLTLPKFAGNAIRTLLFMFIFVALFLLYDAFITNLLLLII